MAGVGSTRTLCLRLEILRTPRETSVACRSLDALEKLPDNVDEATKSQPNQRDENECSPFGIQEQYHNEYIQLLPLLSSASPSPNSAPLLSPIR